MLNTGDFLGVVAYWVGEKDFFEGPAAVDAFYASILGEEQAHACVGFAHSQAALFNNTLLLSMERKVVLRFSFKNGGFCEVIRKAHFGD